MFSIPQALAEDDIILVILPDDQYLDNLMYLVKNLQQNYDKILYVTVNRPYQMLVRAMLKQKVPTDKFIFIDTISGTNKELIKKEDNCYFISNPAAFTELNLLISDIYAEQNPPAIIFDSLASLLIYEDTQMVVKFAHNLISKLGVKGCKIILPCPYDEKHETFLKDLEMFVERVVDLRM